MVRHSRMPIVSSSLTCPELKSGMEESERACWKGIGTAYIQVFYSGHGALTVDTSEIRTSSI